MRSVETVYQPVLLSPRKNDVQTTSLLLNITPIQSGSCRSLATIPFISDLLATLSLALLFVFGCCATGVSAVFDLQIEKARWGTAAYDRRVCASCLPEYYALEKIRDIETAALVTSGRIIRSKTTKYSAFPTHQLPGKGSGQRIASSFLLHMDTSPSNSCQR